MFELLLTTSFALTAVQADQSEIVDEAYSQGDGAVEMCGIAAPDFNGFLRQLIEDPKFIEHNSDTDYLVFVSEKPEFRQLVIARPRETAFPMAYCRKVLANPDGTARLETSMHCEGDKSDCDAVFVEFYNHDQSILSSING